MSAGDHDEDAALANLEAPNPVHNANLADWKVGKRLGCEPLHLDQRHGGVGIVLKIKSAAVTGMIAHHAVKQANCTVLSHFDLARSVAEAIGSRCKRAWTDAKGSTNSSWPPLTGGRSATSSPGSKGVDSAANDWLTAMATAPS